MNEDDATSQGVRAVINSMRKHNRRTVIQPVTLGVGSFDFNCTAYDISLGGIRLKVDIPIESGASVYIQLRNKLKQTAKVIWSADGFLGLSFLENPERVRVGLGNLSNGLS